MNKIYHFLITAVITLSLTGCGYTTGSLLPGYLKTIHVDNFKNLIDITDEPTDKVGYRIYRPELEIEVTNAIIDQFIFDGHLLIVDEDEADLVLTGDLIDYYKQPLSYTSMDDVEEYRIIIAVNMVLKDKVRDRIRWKENNFIGYDTYRLQAPIDRTEEQARLGAIDDLADKTVEKVVEGW